MNAKFSPFRHSETAFESVIEDQLLEHGYLKVTSQFDSARAIFPGEAIAFIQATQPKEWGKLEALHGECGVRLVDFRSVPASFRQRIVYSEVRPEDRRGYIAITLNCRVCVSLM